MLFGLFIQTKKKHIQKIETFFQIATSSLAIWAKTKKKIRLNKFIFFSH